MPVSFSAIQQRPFYNSVGASKPASQPAFGNVGVRQAVEPTQPAVQPKLSGWLVLINRNNGENFKPSTIASWIPGTDSYTAKKLAKWLDAGIEARRKAGGTIVPAINALSRRYAIFFGPKLDLSRIDFTVNADRLALNLADASLKGANLTGTHLGQANLENTDFTGAILDHARLQGTRITVEQLRQAASYDGAWRNGDSYLELPYGHR